MIINWTTKEIRTKIVYYGPAMSGKTTSIRYLFKRFSSLEQLESIETTTGRTLFFDFGALFMKLGEWNIQVNIWSATGQDYYAGTRDTVLTGVDGIIFVADAHEALINENQRSWQELTKILGNALGKKIPVTICLNKSDIPGTINDLELRNHLKVHNSIPIYPTIATDGTNVPDCFRTLLRTIFNGNN
jgi:GTPase SAR1 family protein